MIIFFRRRSFWEKLTGEEKTPIEKVESFIFGILEVVIFVVVGIFAFPPILEILEIVIGIFSILADIVNFFISLFS